MYLQSRGLDVHGQPVKQNDPQLDHLVNIYLNR